MRDWFAAFAREQNTNMFKSGATRATWATSDVSHCKTEVFKVSSKIPRLGNTPATRATSSAETQSGRDWPNADRGSVAQVAQQLPKDKEPETTKNNQSNQYLETSVAHVAHVAQQNEDVVHGTGDPSFDDQNGLLDVDERAAISEFEGCVPHEWADGYAQLQYMNAPSDVPAIRWQQFIDDVGRFLDQWAASATALGWGPLDLFGCDRIKPLARLDRQGLCWLLNGCELIALTKDTAAIRTRSGNCLEFHRRTIAPGGVLVWELQDCHEAGSLVLGVQ